MADHRLELVAVVDAGPKTVTVWHVDIGGGQLGLGRLCGAWVTGDDDDGARTVELVSRERMVLATQSGVSALDRVAARPFGFLDLAATVANIRAERDQLQHLYEQQSLKTLVAPRWPALPAMIDMEEPPLAPEASPEVAAALGVARWLEQLAKVWVEIESQRLRRPYLAEAGGLSVRPCPVTLHE